LSSAVVVVCQRHVESDEKEVDVSEIRYPLI
jgi:hypothetical protein